MSINATYIYLSVRPLESKEVIIYMCILSAALLCGGVGLMPTNIYIYIYICVYLCVDKKSIEGRYI